MVSLQGNTAFTWSSDYSIVQHPLPTPGSEPWAIATDHQGRVWFVEQGSNRLGEYDPASGTMREYPIPTARSNPESVAVDSRGNVWFTELTSNNLGELPAGGDGIREFPVPGPVVNLAGSRQTLACGPTTVLPDPAGTVWLACLFSNQIDEFFPGAGSFASYDLPVLQSGPAGMLLDRGGNLWFAAADSDMLGRAIISQLQNGTNHGISEFAPLNQTYLFRSNHTTSFLGGSDIITSSLPTPSGIVMDSAGKLWITEHVDSSFDSYDPTTQSLVRYWTSQTFGAYGYTVSFPNGVAIGPNGNIWIGEHYGNKIAEFVPSPETMTEYPVPCCNSSIAAVYSVATGTNGKLWFVEIAGNAIGELDPLSTSAELTMSLPMNRFTVDPHGSVAIPMRFSGSTPSGGSLNLSLSMSGVSATGNPQNMTAEFSNSALHVAPDAQATTNLTLSLQGINPGVYYLTVGASSSPGGEIHSAILKLTVTTGPGYPVGVLVPIAAAAVAAASAAGLALARRAHRGHVRRGGLRLDSHNRAMRRTATPPAAAA